MIDFTMHNAKGLRTATFYPENANQVTLENLLKEEYITFFDLPYEQAEALALLFADANTVLFRKDNSRTPWLAFRALQAGEV